MWEVGQFKSKMPHNTRGYSRRKGSLRLLIFSKMTTWEYDSRVRHRRDESGMLSAGSGLSISAEGRCAQARFNNSASNSRLRHLLPNFVKSTLISLRMDDDPIQEVMQCDQMVD